MSKLNLTFIFDGECPFCNHFAELLEIKSNIENLTILDARKNPEIVKQYLRKGYDIDKGAILVKNGYVHHGSDAINTICNYISNPTSGLLNLLSNTFKSKTRTQYIFPFLLRARRLALISKGVSTSLI